MRTKQNRFCNLFGVGLVPFWQEFPARQESSHVVGSSTSRPSSLHPHRTKQYVRVALEQDVGDSLSQLFKTSLPRNVCTAFGLVPRYYFGQEAAHSAISSYYSNLTQSVCKSFNSTYMLKKWCLKSYICSSRIVKFYLSYVFEHLS